MQAKLGLNVDHWLAAVSPLDALPLCSGTSDQMHDSPLSTELFDPLCTSICPLSQGHKGFFCYQQAEDAVRMLFSLGCMIFSFHASVPELMILKNYFDLNVVCFVPSVAKCLLNNDCEQKKVLL